MESQDSGKHRKKHGCLGSRPEKILFRGPNPGRRKEGRICSAVALNERKVNKRREQIMIEAAVRKAVSEMSTSKIRGEGDIVQ